MGGFPWRRKIMSEHQRVEGKPNWKGKSQGPHQTLKPWKLEAKGPLPQQVKPTQNLKPYLNEPKEPPPQQSTTI